MLGGACNEEVAVCLVARPNNGDAVIDQAPPKALLFKRYPNVLARMFQEGLKCIAILSVPAVIDYFCVVGLVQQFVRYQSIQREADCELSQQPTIFHFCRS